MLVILLACYLNNDKNNNIFTSRKFLPSCSSAHTSEGLNEQEVILSGLNEQGVILSELIFPQEHVTNTTWLDKKTCKN